jgi:hypothetical protein
VPEQSCLLALPPDRDEKIKRALMDKLSYSALVSGAVEEVFGRRLS